MKKNSTISFWGFSTKSAEDRTLTVVMVTVSNGSPGTIIHEAAGDAWPESLMDIDSWRD